MMFIDQICSLIFVQSNLQNSSSILKLGSSVNNVANKIYYMYFNINQ